MLASDVFRSGAGVDRLLFGSLIGLTPAHVWTTAAVVAAVMAVDALTRRAWLASAFDPATDRAPTSRWGLRRHEKRKGAGG